MYFGWLWVASIKNKYIHGQCQFNNTQACKGILCTLATIIFNIIDDRSEISSMDTVIMNALHRVVKLWYCWYIRLDNITLIVMNIYHKSVIAEIQLYRGYWYIEQYRICSGQPICHDWLHMSWVATGNESKLIQQTWNPSYVQDPNLRVQVCMSYGKNSTSIKQDDL